MGLHEWFHAIGYQGHRDKRMMGSPKNADELLAWHILGSAVPQPFQSHFLLLFRLEAQD